LLTDPRKKKGKRKRRKVNVKLLLLANKLPQNISMFHYDLFSLLASLIKKKKKSKGS